MGGVSVSCAGMLCMVKPGFIKIVCLSVMCRMTRRRLVLCEQKRLPEAMWVVDQCDYLSNRFGPVHKGLEFAMDIILVMLVYAVPKEGLN